jgi:hypothetical protein
MPNHFPDTGIGIPGPEAGDAVGFFAGPLKMAGAVSVLATPMFGRGSESLLSFANCAVEILEEVPCRSILCDLVSLRFRIPVDSDVGGIGSSVTAAMSIPG